MQTKLITFIICVNNEMYYEECTYYINRLVLPKGYDIDMIAIREADSMCAAYNAGMQSSDAKYKIYMHQDVMIREVHFLEYMIRDFALKNKSPCSACEFQAKQGISILGIKLLFFSV